MEANILKAISFLLLEIVGGLGLYCLWLRKHCQRLPEETEADMKFRRLGFKSLSIKFSAIVILGGALLYYFQWLTFFGLLFMLCGIFYFALAVIEYFHHQENVFAAIHISIPVALFFFIFEPNIWCILYVVMILVYDLQAKRAETT